MEGDVVMLVLIISCIYLRVDDSQTISRTILFSLISLFLLILGVHLVNVVIYAFGGKCLSLSSNSSVLRLSKFAS